MLSPNSVSSNYRRRDHGTSDHRRLRPDSFSGTMPKRKGRGRPKGSTLKKKVKESSDDEVIILDNPSNVLEIDPGFREKQEEDTNMPKKRRRGRPKLSLAQTCQESVHRNLNSHINPSNMVEVGPGRREEPEAADTVLEKRRGRPRGRRVQNCQENVDGKDINSNPSNVMEVSPECKEEPEAVSDVVNTPMQRGQGSTSRNQNNHQQNADENIRVRPNKKGRGRTRALIVQMKRQQSADGKLDVVIHPKRLVAVGPGRNDFITDLSVIVRQNARFNVRQWKNVPQSTRDAIVKNVLDHWRLADTDMIRKAILDEAGRLYRNWRNRLHDHYLMFETKEEAVMHVPDDINESDWKILVDYFSSPSFEIMSTKNKVNRAKLQTNHIAGRKSFQAVSYDARDPVTQKEPDLQTLWQLTHKRANGVWIDEASKEVNDKVAEQINEKLCQVENSQDGMETIEPEIINSAFKTVVGKKSYILGFEAEPTFPNSNRVQQLEAELDAQKKETENAKKECNEIRAKLVKVESQLEEERRKREEIEARLVDRQKEMQEINNQVQTAIQSALSQFHPPKTEAESSLRHKRKIAELEAQLLEAEGAITDIKSELVRCRLG